jgi:hypothetical protein
MTRMIRSSVLLAACLGLWSCTSDPTADEAGVPTAIIANPTVAFVTQGQSQLIKFGLVDELGGLVPSTWTIGAVPPEFTVAFDSSYRVVYNSDGTLTLPDNQSEIRVTLTGIAGGAGSFTVSASGVSLDVPIGIVPTTVPATIAPSSVGLEESSVVTMPAGYTLTPASTFTAGTVNPAYVVSIAGDGSSAEIILTPGSTGPLVISGVELAFLPGTPLTLPTVETVSRPIQDDPTSAPGIALPPLGGSVTFTDPVGDGADQFYQFTVTGTETLRFTTSWAGGADVDMLICSSTACTGFVPGGLGGATGANPEHATVGPLAAGTYVLWENIYDAHDDPPVAYTITIENLAP